MTILLLAEHDNASLNDQTTKALTAAAAIGGDVHVLVAGHNAAAPFPAPLESWAPVEWLPFVPFEHYADAVWDNVRMNNIAAHFVTAFLDVHLKGDAAKAAYLTEDWLGFAEGSARGLRLEIAGLSGQPRQLLDHLKLTPILAPELARSA